MTLPILTHDAYAITSLITLTLGGFFIANNIYEKWLTKFNLQLIQVNFIINFLIVIFGSFIVSWRSLLNSPLEVQLIGAFSGILIGYICLTIESFLISLSPKANSSVTNFANIKPINNILKNKKNIITQKPYKYSYISTIGVGCMEEILYRGFLTVMCISLLSPGLSALALICITIIFALNHLSLGNIHFVTKGILGATCLLSFLMTKTIITPIFIHATFNALVVNKYQRLAYA
jgi:hypothetical protein